MTYPEFRDQSEKAAKYVLDLDLPRNHPLVRAARKKLAEEQIHTTTTVRNKKPHAEWTINDVVLEFRQRWHLKYPMSSPDELGNFQTLGSILGKLRRDNGITIEQMIQAINDFYRQNFGERYPEYPAWKKYLWKVRDQRDRNPEVYANTMRKSASHGTMKRTVSTVQELMTQDPSVEKARAERALAEKRLELEHWLDEQRRHGDWVLEVELGENWAIILEELMKEVGYERPDDRTSGTA